MSEKIEQGQEIDETYEGFSPCESRHKHKYLVSFLLIIAFLAIILLFVINNFHSQEGRVKQVAEGYAYAQIAGNMDKLKRYEYKEHNFNPEDYNFDFGVYDHVSAFKATKIETENGNTEFEKAMGNIDGFKNVYLVDCILSGKDKLNLKCSYYVFELDNKFYCVFESNIENKSYYG